MQIVIAMSVIYFGPPGKHQLQLDDDEEYSKAPRPSEAPKAWQYPVEHVVMVFLAHDGVTQPKVWNLWKDIDSEFSSRIHFCVHVPLEVRKSSIFDSEHGLDIEFGPTAWCNASLVHEHVRALQSSMFLHGDDKTMYFMTSGADIPIKPSRHFFESYETLLSITNYEKPTSYNSQWMAFTAADAATYVREYVTSPDGKPTESFNKDAVKSWCSHPTNEIMSTGCPDEMMVSMLLKRNKFVDFRTPKMLTWEVIWTNDLGSTSPINWYSSHLLFPHVQTKLPPDGGNYCQIPGAECEFDKIRINLAPVFQVFAPNAYGRRYMPVRHIGFKRVLCFYRISALGFLMRKVTKAMDFDDIEWLYRLIFSQDTNAVVAQLDREIAEDSKNTDLANPRMFARETQRLEKLTDYQCAAAREHPDDYAKKLWKL